MRRIACLLGLAVLVSILTATAAATAAAKPRPAAAPSSGGVGAAAAGGATANSGELDPSMLGGLKARAIGPAAMSGRVTAIAGLASNPDVLYAGASTGGLWKSENGGLTWTPIFDDQPVASIGAVAVFQPNPDVVWVGTGEGNPRNSASVGDGVYRSLDAGRTWQHLGLDKTEHIRRIVLHPTDPDVAYVSAEGREWGENPERGIYKTSDGGKSWKRVLYVDERTGGSELVMDPSNPNKLFAGMWDYRRWPWFFRSGGPGSGLYVTYDGGATWKRLSEDDGLPKGNLGRIGMAISASQPQIVYALVEASAKNAFLRSDDGGKSWKNVNGENDVTERPFYYAEIRVDPRLPNRIYDLTSRLRVSDDSGKTFTNLGRSGDIHGDYHAMWIDPSDPRYLVAGEDGGVGISHDRGETWSFVGNLPLGQYYHVTVDMDTPYHIYGGMQDNGSWRGPSSVWERGGIRNSHWWSTGGGDGFWSLPDPADSMSGYSESQGGFMSRFNLRTGERKSIKPPEIDPDPAKRLRFNWNTPIAQDPFDPKTIYCGSQYVWRSADRGESWTQISIDLTTNNKDWQHQEESGGLTIDASGAENYTTIIAIAPSPVERGVIWAGTDDGRVHVTRDGGKNWASVEANLPGVPAHTWVPEIRAGKFAAGTAFVVFDDHRRSNWTPYVYRTDDYGKSWKSLATPNLRGWALAIEQDPVDRDLLFLGTEFGLYFSNDAGAHWLPWKHGLPTVAVEGLVIHPRDHDLVLGTHGRSAYVVDDIAPLRQMTAATLREPLHLYDAGPAQQHRIDPGAGSNGPGSGEFRGENRPYGALITYSLNLPGLPLADEKKDRERKEKERAESSSGAATAREEGEKGVPPAAAKTEDQPEAPGQEAAREAEQPEAEAQPPGGGGRAGGRPGGEGPQVDIVIADASGKKIRAFKGPAKLGVNRAVWDLGRDALRLPPGVQRGFRFQESGPQVLPGSYAVTVKYKGHEAKGTVRVLADPSSKNAAADWQAHEAAVRRTGELHNALVDAIDRVAAAQADVDFVLAKLRKAEAAKKAKGEGGGESGGESARGGDGAAQPPAAETAPAKAAAPGRAAKSGPAGPAAPAAAPSGKAGGKEDASRALMRAAQALKKKLEATQRELYVPPGTKGIVDDRTPLSKVGSAGGSLGSSWDPPNPTQRTNLVQAESAVAAALASVNKVLAEDVAAFRRQAAEAKIELFPAEPPLSLPKAP
ncbi:MAG TPA: hypothetical protein VHR45_14465 [Thermoanaerobaculia bacterium]|nr:hypothetical protein [Thermoanaerobaculia bacterium]